MAFVMYPAMALRTRNSLPRWVFVIEELKTSDFASANCMRCIVSSRLKNPSHLHSQKICGHRFCAGIQPNFGKLLYDNATTSNILRNVPAAGVRNCRCHHAPFVVLSFAGRQHKRWGPMCFGRFCEAADRQTQRHQPIGTQRFHWQR